MSLNNNTNYIDDTTIDGYKILSGAAPYNFDGKDETKRIVNIAKGVITTPWNSANYGDGPDVNAPTSIEELCDAVIAYKAERSAAGDTSLDRWEELFFIPAYMCTLYEPISEVDGEFIDDYKKGKWFLPAVGQLMRIMNFWYNSRGRSTSSSVSSSNANENPSTEARTPIFANMLKRMEDVGLGTSAVQPFKLMNGGASTLERYAASSQANATNSYGGALQEGYIGMQGKNSVVWTRAITQIMFSL